MAFRRRIDKAFGLDTAEEVKGGFVLWLSGADKATLAECPGERGKFVGVGGVVLTTATMAAASASFALIIGARAHPAVAIAIGLFWGLAIMNLDRWLVSATARREKWFQNLFVALPRFVLAFVIGLVISTPLVLWIFQREIDARLNVMIEQKSKSFQEQLNTNPRFAQIKPLQEEVARIEGTIHGTVALSGNTDLDRLRTLRDNAKTAYEKAVEDSLAEWEGRGPSHSFGAGPIWREKKAIETQRKTEFDNAESAYRAALTSSNASLQTDLVRKRADLDTYVKERDAQLAKFEADNKDDRGLLARLDALSALTSSNATLKTAYVALLAFITIIEVLPVVAKFLMSLGPPSAYDRIYASIRDGEVAIAKEKERLRQEAEARLHEMRKTKLQEAEEERLTKVFAAQSEIDTAAIQQRRDTDLGHKPSARRDTSGRQRPPRNGWPRRRADNDLATDPDGFVAFPDTE